MALASDHAGVKATHFLSQHSILNSSVEFLRIPEETNSYPIAALWAIEQIFNGHCEGAILICGSGIGMSIVANRFYFIRAALCSCIEQGMLAKVHNDANVLCFGARFFSPENMALTIQEWLNASFEGGRHQERISLFAKLGSKKID